MNKTTILLTCLVFAFVFAVPTSARAEDAPRDTTATVAPSPPHLPFPAPINNLSGDYQKREIANPLLGSFQGGGSAVYIGGGAVTVLLIVLLVVLIIK
jgi:hypothetical protein